MHYRNISALVFLFCMVSLAHGATWEITVDAPEQGQVLPVAIAEEVLSLDAVRVRVVGYNKVGGYTCDGVNFPEPEILSGTFGEEGSFDDMALIDEIWHDDILGFEFDVIHEFDLSDSSAWAFLLDGTGEFTVSWERMYQDPMGFCTHLFSEFHLYSITLSIDYNGAVPVVPQSWGTLKARYRE